MSNPYPDAVVTKIEIERRPLIAADEGVVGAYISDIERTVTVTLYRGPEQVGTMYATLTEEEQAAFHALADQIETRALRELQVTFGTQVFWATRKMRQQAIAMREDPANWDEVGDDDEEEGH